MSSRWVGRCGECQQWGSVDEAPIRLSAVASVTPLTAAVPITAINTTESVRYPTGIEEFDRVLGGGLVPGAVVLLAGAPGVGKSTLLLELCSRWAETYGRTLYITGEESPSQVRLRAVRTGAESEQLFLAAETDLGMVIAQIEQVEPSLVVIDSVQTIDSATAEGSVGGVTQVKEVTTRLIRVAKQSGIPVVLVGHITKDGAIAGPKTLEHLVDVVVSFEGENHSGFRIVRATKNRYGPADEIGCFELDDNGIQQVLDPTGVFISNHCEPVGGTAITVSLQGSRPLATEIQALVVPTTLQAPRRVCHGLDSSGLAMILAVLQRRVGLRFHTLDVYASTVGGAKINDPGADLGLACALASALLDQPLPEQMVVIGEIGLAGDIRRVCDLDRRLAEAARLGVVSAIIPPDNRRSPPPANLQIIESPTLSYALDILDLRKAK